MFSIRKSFRTWQKRSVYNVIRYNTVRLLVWFVSRLIYNQSVEGGGEKTGHRIVDHLIALATVVQSEKHPGEDRLHRTAGTVDFDVSGGSS